MLPVHKVVEEEFLAVNQLIIDSLYSDIPLVENIGHYLIEAGGKRLRPLLVILTAKALGYKGDEHLSLAAVIEFIHTATLLHDDVVDTSSMRRGRLTANAKWGNAPSVLVGDFLYSRAFQIVVTLGQLELMKILSDTTNKLSEGEVQQLVNAKQPDTTEEQYREVIYKKTGALFEAASATAAVISNASQAEREAVCQYARHLGLAFQLVDDTLDYEGDPEELGKNVGDDLAEGKPTLPLIRAMQIANTEQAKTIAEAIRNGDKSHLDDIVAIVKSSGALEYAHEQAKAQAAKAKSSIASLEETKYKQALLDLADFSISRAF